MLDIYRLKKNKIKNEILIKKIGESAGEIKHYPAATKEWFNSVYTFNKNTIKSLPSADVYVAKLIRSYFNLFSLKFEIKARVYVERFKIRRLKMNRILLGKPEFKHTNDKVVITLYIYNQELIEYKKKLNKIKNINFFKNLNIMNILDNEKVLNNNTKSNIFIIKNIFTRFLKEVKSLNLKYINNLKHSFFKLEKLPMIYLVKKILIKLRVYYHIKKIIHLNKSKFNSIHIYPLKIFLQKIYGKEVEFNIISLKRYNLNSSILMKIMSIKLRDRKNRILRVIRKVLTRINLPYTRRLQYPVKSIKVMNIQNLIVRNNLDDNYFKKIPYVNLINYRDLSKNNLKRVLIKKIRDDKLNILLKSLYPKQYLMNLSKNRLFVKIRNLENTVLDSVKNKVISGLRIEASGRLSKRLIASRAVFKMRQKGSIRNMDSSYKELSTVLLRGSVKSNLDFSRSKGKTRIGAFGLKGWVSSV